VYRHSDKEISQMPIWIPSFVSRKGKRRVSKKMGSFDAYILTNEIGRRIVATG
jgi:hypothetical protein